MKATTSNSDKFQQSREGRMENPNYSQGFGARRQTKSSSILMLRLFIVCLQLCWGNSFCQVSTVEVPFGQTYSKYVSEYMSKSFIMNEIVMVENGKAVKIEIDAITSASSGELTSIVYNCAEQNKRGLVLSFWDYRVNNLKIRYRGFGFKDLPYNEAVEFLNLLANYIDADLSNGDGNLFIRWNDFQIIVYKDSQVNHVRIFWNDFDAEWDISNIRTTIKRFGKKLPYLK